MDLVLSRLKQRLAQHCNTCMQAGRLPRVLAVAGSSARCDWANVGACGAMQLSSRCAIAAAGYVRKQCRCALCHIIICGCTLCYKVPLCITPHRCCCCCWGGGGGAGDVRSPMRLLMADLRAGRTPLNTVSLPKCSSQSTNTTVPTSTTPHAMTVADRTPRCHLAVKKMLSPCIAAGAWRTAELCNCCYITVSVTIERRAINLDTGKIS